MITAFLFAMAFIFYIGPAFISIVAAIISWYVLAREDISNRRLQKAEYKPRLLWSSVLGGATFAVTPIANIGMAIGAFEILNRRYGAAVRSRIDVPVFKPRPLIDHVLNPPQITIISDEEAALIRTLWKKGEPGETRLWPVNYKVYAGGTGHWTLDKGFEPVNPPDTEIEKIRMDMFSKEFAGITLEFWNSLPPRITMGQVKRLWNERVADKTKPGPSLEEDEL